MVGAGTRVYVPGLEVDKGFLAQLGQIGAQGRLQLLHVDGVLHTRFDLAKGRYAGLLVLGHLQNHETLLGADDVGNVASFHRESFIFEFLGECATIEVSQVATLRCAGAVRIFFCDVLKFSALANLSEQIVGFGLRHSYPLLFGRRIRGVLFLSRNQNFA